jgi:hypothetical protein
MNEYKVCFGGTLHELHEVVNQAIKLGWFPLGGVCYENNNNFFLQAMIFKNNN